MGRVHLSSFQHPLQESDIRPWSLDYASLPPPPVVKAARVGTVRYRALHLAVANGKSRICLISIRIEDRPHI